MSFTSYNTVVEISCRRKGKTYKFTNLVEFQVTIDLDEEVCGSFSFSLSNNKGQFSGWISMYDAVRLFVNGKLVMVGNVDKVEYKYDNSDNIIVVEGRDRSWKVADNCRTPKKGNKKKKYNVKKEFKNMCKRWSMNCVITKVAVPPYKALTVGCNESEISVMANCLADTDFRVFYLVDKLYLSKWNLNANASYTINYDAIEEATITEDGKDAISEIRVYQSTKAGGYKKKSTIKNKYLTARGIKKIKTHRKYSEGSSTKMKTVGLKRMREGYMKSCEMKLKIRPSSGVVLLPNVCVNINIPKLGITQKMFVRKVEYLKDFDKGTSMELTLIPSNTSYTSMWTQQTITHSV